MESITGRRTNAPWGVRNAHPDADVPSGEVGYHSGGLYEMVLAVAWRVRSTP